MSHGGGPHKYNLRDEPLSKWDAVANVTKEVNANSTIYSNGRPAIEMTPTDALYYALSILAMVLFCFCSRSRIPDERFRLAAAERRARFLERQERRVRMQQPEYREELVTKALIIKRVIEEKDGQLTLGDDEVDGDDASSGEGSLSIDSTDDDINTCVVCLEPFRVGDVVAWSRTQPQDPEAMICNHVFHRDCIVSWLSQPMHDDCPSCRAQIVREDGEEDDELSQGTDTEGYAASAFIIMHGLVSRAKRASYSLIGQNVDLEEEIPDFDSNHTCHPKVPPSPMRRVFSLEGPSQVRRRSVALRRRPSDRSMSSQSISLVDGSDLSDLSPGSHRSIRHQLSPQMLRRVVSDLAQVPLVPLARSSSVGQQVPLSLPVRDQDYQSAESHDFSEHSLGEEEDVVLHQVASNNDISGNSCCEAVSENEICDGGP